MKLSKSPFLIETGDSVIEVSVEQPSNIYLISDWHFYHKNIMLYGNRPFDDVASMHKTIIDLHNTSVTSSKDTPQVIVVGDVSVDWLKKKDGKHITHLQSILSNMIGCKYLVRGNHDRKFTDEEFADMGFAKITDFMLLISEKQNLTIAVAHDPAHLCLLDKYNPDFGICGHLHNGTTIIEGGNYPIFDVAVESLFYRPISLANLITIYKNSRYSYEEKQTTTSASPTATTTTATTASTTTTTSTTTTVFTIPTSRKDS
jgi:calcineurin-like phosphoesterase family protein